jgi:hypothetical protein
MTFILRRNPGLSAGTAVFLTLAPMALRQPTSYDGARMKLVAVSLADRYTPIVVQTADGLGLNTPYSNYGIGMSLVFAPLYKLGQALGVDGVRLMNLAGPLLFAATCAVVIQMLRRRNIHGRGIAITALVCVAGTPMLAYAITDFAEPGVALSVALGVFALDALGRGARFASLGAGAATGLAILFRADSVLLIAAPVVGAVFALGVSRWRDLTLFASGCAPFLAIWGAYNAARFDGPLDAGYHGQPFSHPFTEGVYGLTLSPGRGVFVYAPIVLVAIAITSFLGREHRVLAIFAATLLILRVVFYARWWAWYGGAVWGPRFLLPVLPAFAPLVASWLERHPRSPSVLAAGIGGMLLAVVGVSTTTNPDRNPYLPREIAASGRELVERSTSADYVRSTDRLMFDWTRFPMRR